MNPQKGDRLLARYWRIRDEHAVGYGLPILRHLALRRETGAMVVLSQTQGIPGRLANRNSQVALCYRAYRQGDPIAAQNLALTRFNCGDMAGYRYWLVRAARLGDGDARAELRRFETRLPHMDAALIGRRRPERISARRSLS